MKSKNIPAIVIGLALLAVLGSRISDGIQRGYARVFMPPWVWRKNRLPAAGIWALWPLLGFPVVFTAETLRRTFPALEPIADAEARRRRLRWFRAHMGARRAEYRPAETFTR